MEADSTIQQEVIPAQNTTPEPNATPSSPVKKNNNTIIIGIVILFMVAVGGMLYFGTQPDKLDPIPLPQEPTNSLEPSIPSETVITSDSPLVINSPISAPISKQVNGADLNGITYTLPQGWKAEIRKDGLNNEGLFLAPETGGGYLSIRVYEYSGTSGRREYYCQVRNVCVEGTSYFSEMNIGNISGYAANALDNSGGGAEYFGAKGNKFYVISSFYPPSPNQFENTYRNVLDSLRF